MQSDVNYFVQSLSFITVVIDGFNVAEIMCRDQLNSRFYGRDIFREIDLLPRKTLISVKSVIFREF